MRAIGQMNGIKLGGNISTNGWTKTLSFFSVSATYVSQEITTLSMDKEVPLVTTKPSFRPMSIVYFAKKALQINIT